MTALVNKSLILLFTLFLAVILCGAVSATSNVTTGKNISVVSTHTSVSTTHPKLIDSGVTYTKNYLVKKDKWGRYSTGTGDQAYPGMKYPTKYYWTTYLYPNGNIVIHTVFYHTSLKRNIYQTVVIGKLLYGNKNMIYHSVTPKSWGGSGYWTLDGFWGSPLNFYWNPVGGYHSFRYYLIYYAPEGPG